jgi:uncharacterized protein YndB with AHSA1/START domain
MTSLQETQDRLVIRRLIPAPREDVFAAWTDPESIKHWMCPGNIVTTEAQLDLRVGGSFRIVMKGRDREVEHTGEYRVIDRPSKLAFTWVSQHTNFHPSLVTVELFDRSDQCELVLTHERLPGTEAVEAHRNGWRQIADRLAAHFEKKARESRTPRR